MKTKEILILGLFIIAVCAISLIPFSRILSEGEGFKEYNTSGNVTTPPITTGGKFALNTSAAPTTNAQDLPLQIKTNSDFIKSVITAISKSPNQHNDKIAIFNIQGMISSLKTQNSATLLGEMSNPNNLTDPRFFLQYMNWFASHCPIDSDDCTGLC
jgi:hypothetical protein